MRGSSVRAAVRTWLPFAIASLVAATAAFVLPRFHPTPHPQRPVKKTAWQWNDDSRLTLCLSKQGARPTYTAGFADLNVKGTLVGFGEMSHSTNPQDTGNQIGCDNYPQQYIEVQDGGRETWRIMYATQREHYPAVHAALGSQVRFWFQAVFHSDQVARFLLLDEGGPVMAIEMDGYGPRGFDEGHLLVSWGPMFGHRPTGCGGDEVARALQIAGDTDASIPPGQVGSFVLHGASFHFWNIHSVNVIDGPCVDGGDSTSWVLWRD
jgi:hypothetical protein